MLLQRRIDLKIILMALGMLIVLTPSTWAGPKQRQRNQHSYSAQKRQLYQAVFKQDGYCPPQVITNYASGKGYVTVTTTCAPHCLYCLSGLTVYSFHTSGLTKPDIMVISSTNKDFKGVHPTRLPTGSEEIKYRIPTQSYHALVGSTNLLLKLQYMNKQDQQVYTVFTTILLIKSH